MHWRVFFAAAAGRNHLADGVGCQDFGHFEIVDASFAGAVCDGAGSAAEGRLGAELFACAVTRRLADALRADRWPGDGPSSWLALLQALVGEARASVAGVAEARSLALGDFACTLVGCLAGRAGGCFFHVGDGFAVHRQASGACEVSRPENGEFADETYFVTGDNWQEHLRVTALAHVAPGSLIGLMSDGAVPFVVNRAKSGFFPPFIDPVAAYLGRADEPAGSRALGHLLADEKTLAITGDDKALLLALAG